MPDPLTPDSTRREGVSVRPVRLSDGAEWGFVRPEVRLAPRVEIEADPLGRPVERVALGVGFGYPADIERRIAGVRSACEGGTVANQYEAFFSLATCLLRRAHEISVAAACELLEVSEDDLPRLVREVMAVVSESGPAHGAESHGGTDQ